MALWTDIVDPAELTAFSRVAQENTDTGILNTVLPNLFQDEVKFTWKVNQILADEAEYGEFDTEAPIGQNAAAEEKTMRLLPISRKNPISEYEQLTDPEAVSARADEKAIEITQFITNRINRARAEVLVTGRLNLKENGIVQNVNFGRAAKLTNAAPASAWSASGADPISDLQKWAEELVDTGGVPPEYLIASTKIASAMGSAIAAAGYITTSSPTVSRAAVNEVLQAHSLPTLTVYDGRLLKRRYIPEDTLVLAPASGLAGRTVFAPTVESRDPRYNLPAGEASGIVAGLYREDDPPIAWVLGKAISVPVLSNPDTTLSAKVL